MDNRVREKKKKQEKKIKTEKCRHRETEYSIGD